jgi:hypothetical protein
VAICGIWGLLQLPNAARQQQQQQLQLQFGVQHTTFQSHSFGQLDTMRSNLHSDT